jgi:hypothetical protein
MRAVQVARAGAVVGLLAAAGCPAPMSPAEPDMTRAAEKPAAPSAAATAATPTGATPTGATPTGATPAGATPTPAGVPIAAEVELGGRIDNRPAFKGDVHAWVTDGPCWQPATRSLGTAKAQPDGSFFIEVFVPQGTPLWVCTATADGSASGALEKAPLSGKGLGEVSYSGLHLTLAKSKRVTAPPPKIPTPPPPKK